MAQGRSCLYTGTCGVHRYSDIRAVVAASAIEMARLFATAVHARQWYVCITFVIGRGFLHIDTLLPLAVTSTDWRNLR